MNNSNSSTTYSDEYLQEILERTNTIAMIGLSSNWNRPSYFAAKYLQCKGYKVIPVNSNEYGKEILGEIVYANLTDIKIQVDMVDIFRKRAAVKNIVDDAISIGTKTIWMQLGIIDIESANKALKKNIDVIMDRCPKIEYARMSGELGWGGINTLRITNKKRIIRRKKNL